MANRKLLYNIGLSLVLHDDLGGGMGGRSKREGIYVYIQLIYSVLQQKLAQDWEATMF